MLCEVLIDMDLGNITDEFMIYGTLFSLSNRIQTFVDGQLKNITAKEQFLLVVLSLFKDTKPNLKEVASVIGCSYQNVKRMADSLEKKGFLSVERDADDRRKYSLSVTEKFMDLSLETEQDSYDFMRVLYQGISQDDLRCTLNTLVKMEQNLLIESN